MLWFLSAANGDAGVDRFGNFVPFAACRSVLEELRDLWEQNILKSGVIGRDEIEENPPQG